MADLTMEAIIEAIGLHLANEPLTESEMRQLIKKEIQKHLPQDKFIYQKKVEEFKLVKFKLLT